MPVFTFFSRNKNKKFFKILFFPLFFLLSIFLFDSCATNSRLNKVYVTNSTRVELLPLSAISQPICEYQYFEGNFDSKSFFADLFLQADQNEIYISISSSFGISAGSIFFDGENIEFESDFFPKNLKCEYIILDLQNAYADFSALKNHYEKYKIDFEENSDSEKTVRKIKKNQKTIEEIQIEKNKITIENYLRKYKYTLITAES